MERLGGTIGYIFGAVVIVPLVFMFLNKNSINRNDFSTFKADYLKDTIEIVLKIPNSEIDSLAEGYPFDIYDFTTTIARKGGRDVSSRSWMYFRKIKDENTGKYYSINHVDGDRSLFSAINDNRFLARINIHDSESNFYGTSENPIPVFSVKGIEKPLESYSRKGDLIQLNVSEEQYAYSAEMYWTYVATKDEFERRFGKNK